MKRFVGIGTIAILAMAAWCALVFAATDGGWFKRPLTSSSEAGAFLAAARDVADGGNRGNLALVLVEDGKLADSHYASNGAAVDANSLFQVASLGKWLTAWGVMVLVEDGAIDLDAPVGQYLTRWQLPASEFDHDGVTVRRLLSHTAGLADGLGYDGFATAAEVQSLEDSLTRAGDASPGNDGIVRVGRAPGEAWDYSGGGFTLLQLLVEEVSGRPFAAFMAERVFLPLGMTRTTFDHERAVQLGLAENFNLEGTPEPFRHYTALAATSLFTTAGDLGLFLQAQAGSEAQEVLSGPAQQLMRSPHASSMGADVWGLGTMLYAPNNAGGFVIGHDGNNGPAINTAARLDPETGDGIVVLETGSPLLATELAGEWVFWKTGNVDNLMFAMGLESMLLWMALGVLAVFLLALVLGWATRRQSRA